MIIKKKSILVIILSSITVAIVLVATLFGFHFYLNWEEAKNRAEYNRSVYELNAKMFSKYITISSLFLGASDDDDHADKAVIEGHIKNNSDKKIISMKLRIAIVDKDNRVLYAESLYPLYQKGALVVSGRESGQYLSPNDSISFKRALESCPKDIVTYLRMKMRFARDHEQRVLNLDYKIEGLILK